jgi:peptide deformylase
MGYPVAVATEERLARRAAALARLRGWGDPVLRTPARRVDAFDDALHEQVLGMEQLMDDALGVGLAAPQVGVLRRLFVYRFRPDEPLGVLVNPELRWASEERQTLEEGCLSIPDVYVPVERAAAVRMAGLDRHGTSHEVEASGPDAAVLQHELDHLDGVLMLDRTTPEHRRAAIRALTPVA